MKLLISIVMLYSFTACAHWSKSEPKTADSSDSVKQFYTFQTVNMPAQRNVSSDLKKGKKVPQEKFVAVYKCEKGNSCTPDESAKKLVPYDQFVAKVKAKGMQKGVDVVDQQQRMLAKGIERLKQQRNEVHSENAYYKNQLSVYRYASLKPVVDNFKRAKTATDEEITMISSKIEKYDKDLQYLKNVKGIRLGMDMPTEKVMELVEVGQWSFGEGKDETVLWNFLQQVGYDLAQNN
jgi:hypothetical protein